MRIHSEFAKDGRELVMTGRLNEHSAEDVLLALSISRQFTLIEFVGSSEDVAANVFLKAGMVLAAETQDGLRAEAALQSIQRMDLEGYKVYRLPPLPEYPTPLGRLGPQLLSDTRDEVEQVASPKRPSPEDVANELPSSAADAGVGAAEEATSPESFGRALASEALNRSLRISYKAPPVALGLTETPGSPRIEILRSKPSVPETPAEDPDLVAGVPVLAVASPKGGSGKTTITLNTSIALARRNLEVVLVDGDPNGDVLSALGARERATAGVYDVMAGNADLSSAMVRTVVPSLRVLPALGRNSSTDSLLGPESGPRPWQRLLRVLGQEADVVVIDTPAGMFGLSDFILRASTAVLGVLQAEPIALRSFPMFESALAAMPNRPEVVGVVLNMVDSTNGASVEAVSRALDSFPPSLLLQTRIPRDLAFSAAALNGIPLGLEDNSPAPEISQLFVALAAEVQSRAGIRPLVERPSARPGSPFLL